jgi:lipopolysaccharide cholinephosphotransferase
MELIEGQQKIVELIKVFDKVCVENGIWYTLAYGSVLGAIRHGGFIPWDSDMDVFVQISDIDKLRQALEEGIPDEMKLYVWDKEEKYSQVFDRLGFRNVSHHVFHVDIFPLIGAPNPQVSRRNFARTCWYSYKFLHSKHKEIQYVRPSNVNKTRFVKKLARLVPEWLIRKWYHYLENKYDFEKAEYVYTIAGNGYTDCLPKKLLLETNYVRFEDIELPVPAQYDEYLTKVYGDYMTPKRY